MNDMDFTKRAIVTESDVDVALAMLADKVYLPDMAGVILFCSAIYDYHDLEEAINKHFSCVVIGCSTAGEIGPEYVNGISAISFSSRAFKFHPVLIDLDENFQVNKLAEINQKLSELGEGSVGENSLGFLLIDGLSMKEEVAIAKLHYELPRLPIFGGSAGDGLIFEETRVFMNGEFYQHSAVFTFIETSLDFELFKLQHFEPSDTEFIVTKADSANRIVYELDGEPAAKYFAETLGLEVKDLHPKEFSINPLMLQIGDDWYVRAIQKVTDDGGLVFWCAIDNGLPLTLGKCIDIEQNLREKVTVLKGVFSSVELTLGCDCILRRIEILDQELQEEISHIFNEINFSGFSTYGEQFNSLHINQTLTGVIFGEKKNAEQRAD